MEGAIGAERIWEVQKGRETLGRAGARRRGQGNMAGMFNTVVE